MTDHTHAKLSRPLIGILLSVIILFAAACGASASATGGTSGGASGGSTAAASTNTPTVAPTTKPKPTSMPTFNLAECQKLLSLSAANQIAQPVIAATTIIPDDSGGTGGSCNYVYGTNNIDVYLFFEPYTGIPLTTLAQAALQKSHAQEQVTTAESVSGVGDQAYFFAGKATSAAATTDDLYVVYGSIVFSVNNQTFMGMNQLKATADETVKGEFIQIAQLVISQL